MRCWGRGKSRLSSRRSQWEPLWAAQGSRLRRRGAVLRRAWGALSRFCAPGAAGRKLASECRAREPAPPSRWPERLQPAARGFAPGKRAGCASPTAGADGAGRGRRVWGGPDGVERSPNRGPSSPRGPSRSPAGRAARPEERGRAGARVCSDAAASERPGQRRQCSPAEQPPLTDSSLAVCGKGLTQRCGLVRSGRAGPPAAPAAVRRVAWGP